MFNGIIKNTGKISKIYKKGNNCFIEIFSKMKFTKNEIGSSISCSGVCLTIERYNKNHVKFYISKETLNKTILKSSKKGDIINLEKPLKFGNEISGHFVQGHIDTISKLKKKCIYGKSWYLYFSINKSLKKFLNSKSSVAINGVSLTIAKVFANSFLVVVIPHTLKLTNLKNIKNNDIVNIEIDIIAKYIKNLKK